MSSNFNDRRPPMLRRSWLFTPGLDVKVQQQALDSGADVVVADLEEFTLPADRPAARERIRQLFENCRGRHIVAAVRINKLELDGIDDLKGVMPGVPDTVFLPHVDHPDQIRRLDGLLAQHERQAGLPVGITEIVPTLESALGVVNTLDILRASNRVVACLLAAEDLSADLGLERQPDGIELHHLRSRFVVECIAAGCIPIDCPFNYRDAMMLEADLAWARRVGFKSKCTVFPEQVAIIHSAYTPSVDQLRHATAQLSQYVLQREGKGIEGKHVDAPDANTAQRLCQRHEQFEQYAHRILNEHHQGAEQ